MLIDRKINLNEINNDGDTPLMLVAKKNPKENVRLIKKLIDSGDSVPQEEITTTEEILVEKTKVEPTPEKVNTNPQRKNCCMMLFQSPSVAQPDL